MLAVSAAVTTAIAWTCALWSPNLGTDLSFRTVSLPWWGLGEEAREVTGHLEFGVGYDIALVGADSIGAYHLRAGWPVRAFEYAKVGRLEQNGALIRWTRSGWQVPYRGLVIEGWRDAIPLRPIWPGALMNTIVYCIATAVMVRWTARLRRIVRARRGFCPQCGYDLHGEVGRGCAECGWKRSEVA